MTDNKPKYVRKKCIHDKYSYYCKECGGGGICPHDKVRSICKDCKGSSVCVNIIELKIIVWNVVGLEIFYDKRSI
jgi:hypothetical protein